MKQSVAQFLGLKKSMVVLLGMVVLVGMGERLGERFLPIYLQTLGGGVVLLGLFGGMNNLLGALYSFPGGYLSDRFGYKRALIFFNLLSMAGFLIVALIPHRAAVLAGAALFLSWSAISLPATMSMISRVLPSGKRTMGVSMHALVRRIPMAFGPVIGGLLIGWFGMVDGIRYAFAAAALLGAISLIFQQTMIEEPSKKDRRAEANPFALFRQMSPALRRLLASDILIRFCEQIPYVFVVVWCVRNVGVSPLEFGVLTAIEMATAVLVYIPVAWLADRTAKRPFIIVTFGFFALFPLVLLLSGSMELLVTAFVVRGLKEFGEPARKAMIMELSPPGKEAGMFGLYYLLRDTIVSMAAFGGAFLWDISPELNLLAAAGFGLIGMILFAATGPDKSE
ncbi:MAG: MFS transporter [Planctomycetes bacterium RBG_16_59_8]|nr:MAG: MFS transporter [Planctomycetes bacterium RBG_16_59_8]